MLVQITPDVKKTFRGDNYTLRTSSLFHDRWRLMMPDLQVKYLPLFSLHTAGVIVDEDRELICARDAFIAEGDVTGYKFAVKYLEGWQHWLRLMNCGWFKDAVDLWVSELEAKLQAEALAKVRLIAQSSSPSAFSASKYLADQGYRKGGSKRGRPSKIEVENNLREAAQSERDLESDFKRVAPHLVAVS